jgi:hypothetical protein
MFSQMRNTYVQSGFQTTDGQYVITTFLYNFDGMGAGSLAQRIGRLPLEARGILCAHQQTYHTFWDWSDAAVAHAMLTGSLHTALAGMSMPAQMPIRGRSGTSRCRRTAPR